MRLFVRARGEPAPMCALVDGREFRFTRLYYMLEWYWNDLTTVTGHNYKSVGRMHNGEAVLKVTQIFVSRRDWHGNRCRHREPEIPPADAVEEKKADKNA